MTAPAPQVLVLPLADETKFNEIYSGLYSAISGLYLTVRKTTVDDAYSFLLSHGPSAVLVDGGLASTQHQHLQKQLARYAKAGGTVIFGCMFYSLTDSFALKDLFETFDLDWALGDYGRAKFSLNAALRPVFGAQVFARLEQTYDMKCLQLLYAPLFGRVYVPTGRSRSASLLYAPSGIDQGESPAVFTRYGQGFLGYVGDFANEEGSQALTMAMLGTPFLPFSPLKSMLTQKQRLPPNTFPASW